MENEPEVIRDQMQETRTALTEKLEALEQKVVDTVQTTTSTVTGTVQAVKDTVEKTVDTVSGTMQQTVDTVKETFDLRLQVDRHPWMMMLGSIAVGYIGGRLLMQSSDMFQGSSFGHGYGRGSALTEKMSEAAAPPRRHNGFHGRPDGGSRISEEVARSDEETRSAGESWLSGLMDNYHEEIDQLKGLAIGAAAAVARDLLTQSIKGEMGKRLSDWMNGLTEKLGGKLLTEPILAPATNESSSAAPGRPEPAEQGQLPEEGKGAATKKGTHNRRSAFGR